MFAEIFEHIDFSKRLLNSSEFSANSSVDKIINNIKNKKYKFGSQRIVRTEKNINGDDISIVLKLKGTEAAVYFYKNMPADMLDKFRSILISLGHQTFSKNIFISRAPPYNSVHDVISKIQDFIKNGVQEHITVEINQIGGDSETRTLGNKIQNKLEYVPKADVSLSVYAKEKKTGKISDTVSKKFQIKGQQSTIETTSLQTLISALYSMLETPPKILVENYQYSLKLKPKKGVQDQQKTENANARKELQDTIFKQLKSFGRLRCQKNIVAETFGGFISGSDNSVFFKIDTAGVVSLNVQKLKTRIQKSSSVFLDTGGLSDGFQINFVEIDDKTHKQSIHRLFNIRFRQAKIEITINKNLFES